MSALRKNVASQNVYFTLVNATTGAALTGATVTARVSKDNGVQAAGSGTVTEDGNGQYHYIPAQAETNATAVGMLFTATNAIPVHIHCFTAAFDPTDAVRMGLTALPNAVAGGNGGLPTGDANAAVKVQAGTGVGQLNFTSGVVDANVVQFGGTNGTFTAGKPTVQDVAGNVAGSVASVTGNVGGNVVGSVGSVTGNVGGNVVGSTGTIATGGIALASFAADTGLQSARSNTAQAGAAGTITLDASASATNDFYAGMHIYLTGGTGVGQVRLCTAYNGATKVATIAPNWATNPDATSTFAILTAAQVSGVTGSVTVGTNNDKTGYALSASGIQAIWDALTAALTTAGSIGKLFVDNLNATVSSRLASASISLAGGAVTVGTNNDKTGYTVAAGGIGATSFAAGAIDSAAIAADAIGSSELAQSAAQEIADEMLNRDIAGGSSGGVRNVRSALRRLRNRIKILAGTATVYQEDDTTAAWTAAVTTAAGNPVSEVDPA